MKLKTLNALMAIVFVYISCMALAMGIHYALIESIK